MTILRREDMASLPRPPACPYCGGDNTAHILRGNICMTHDMWRLLEEGRCQ